VVVLTFLAALKLSDEFRRLLWDQGRTGAIDLRVFFRRTRHWFAGDPVYGNLRSTFPPASFLIYWPFCGWLSLSSARYFWALTTIAVLIWLCRLIIRESGARNPLERVFVAFILLSMNAVGVTIGNGQLILHLLPLLITVALILDKGPPTWSNHLLAAGLFLVALVKPNVTAPFFWLVIFLPGSLWPAVLVVIGYVLLTLVSASFQPTGFISLVKDWLARSEEWAVLQGYANLHNWLGTLGLDQWLGLASGITMLALGLWIYLHRNKDVWLLLGVIALVARFSAYHNMYDDALILLPMISLFRIASNPETENNNDMIAGGLLALTLIVMVLPARMIHFPSPWQYVFTLGHMIAWLLVLLFLGYYTRIVKALDAPRNRV
jgi:Glycosyltransferase family 87